MNSPLELSNINEISRMLKVPNATVYYWVSRDEIPYIKVGRHLRFNSKEVLDWFTQKTMENKPTCLMLGPKLKAEHQQRSLTIRRPRTKAVHSPTQEE